MKKVFTVIVLVFISISLFPQSYRYKGETINLRVDSTMFVIQSDKQLTEQQNSVLKEQLQKGEIDFYKKISDNHFLVVADKPRPGYYDYFSNVYRNVENGMIIILPRIVVMLKQGYALQPILDKYKGKLSQENRGNQKYILTCKVASSENVLQLVNELDIRDDVVWCEPELLSEYRFDNILYPEQYYLKNTGQNGGTAGIDINVEPAWSITNGNTSITVAVIDAGVDRNHEDMGTRVLEGFTIGNPDGDGEPQNPNSLDTKYHGMACAGIIAATNNTIGIRGIASNVNILPVNIVPNAAFEFSGNIILGFGTNIQIAQAISWAWRRADILSCSWGGGAPSNDIAATIDSARTLGRNGRGCVVVFASGNDWPDDTDVAFPGRLDGVITVGSINNQGTIWNYSQRGPSMDLVAPSGNVGSGDVRTTDRMGSLGRVDGSYLEDFGGTSAACPQVAGVAALMLSVRPDLTEAQVRTTLQNTARDIGSSGFDNTYGFGLVNSYSAIQSIYPYISGSNIVCSTGETFTINNAPIGSTITWSSSTNITLPQDIHVNPIVVTANGNGSGWIQAELITYGITVTLPANSVIVGSPTPFITAKKISGIDEPTEYEFTATPYFIGATYNWYIGSTLTYTDYYPNNKFSLYYPCNVTKTVKCKITNTCGTSSFSNSLTKTGGCRSLLPLNISPNPASDYVQVSLSGGDSFDQSISALSEVSEPEGSTRYIVSITDMYGKKVYASETETTIFNIPISIINNGTYIIMVTDNKTIWQGTLIVNH